MNCCCPLQVSGDKVISGEVPWNPFCVIGVRRSYGIQFQQLGKSELNDVTRYWLQLGNFKILSVACVTWVKAKMWYRNAVRWQEPKYSTKELGSHSMSSLSGVGGELMWWHSDVLMYDMFASLNHFIHWYLVMCVWHEPIRTVARERSRFLLIKLFYTSPFLAPKWLSL